MAEDQLFELGALLCEIFREHVAVDFPAIYQLEAFEISGQLVQEVVAYNVAG